jgi:hypothetical protein
MNKRIHAICAALVALAAVGGCSQEEEKTVSLAGEVTYADYESGVIVIEICETESSVYTSGGSVFSEVPGDCVEQIVLEAPGEFSTVRTFTWAEGHKPKIEIYAYLLPTAGTDYADCEAGASALLKVANHEEIALALVADECPQRM